MDCIIRFALLFGESIRDAFLSLDLFVVLLLVTNSRLDLERNTTSHQCDKYTRHRGLHFSVNGCIIKYPLLLAYLNE